jgi:hypothetical protein
VVLVPRAYSPLVAGTYAPKPVALALMGRGPHGGSC